LPPTLAPGEAIYVHSNQTIDLGAPTTEERIRYYHEDHLGSSSVMTDANGALVEETAFYPFGIPRNERRLCPIEESYKFTQKERDPESGLHYFEARYLTPALSRFAIPDPKYANPDALVDEDAAAFLSTPQQMNIYAYAHNNPLKYVDPTGLDDWFAIGAGALLGTGSETLVKEAKNAGGDVDKVALQETVNFGQCFAESSMGGSPVPGKLAEQSGLIQFDRSGASCYAGIGTAIATDVAVPV